jgi:hypothetical protein
MRVLAAMVALLAVPALLLSSPALAQESIYDYQGRLMFGNALEIFTASLTFFGPLTNPNTEADLQFKISGTAVNESFTSGGDCPIDQFCDQGATRILKIDVNTVGARFRSADITFIGSAEEPPPGFSKFVSIDAVIGQNGDSFSVTPNFPGDGTAIFTSNDTPGRWTEVPVKAPELDAASLSGALTLLAGGLLVLRGRRRRSECWN